MSCRVFLDNKHSMTFEKFLHSHILRLCAIEAPDPSPSEVTGPELTDKLNGSFIRTSCDLSSKLSRLTMGRCKLMYLFLIKAEYIFVPSTKTSSHHVITTMKVQNYILAHDKLVLMCIHTHISVIWTKIQTKKCWDKIKLTYIAYL